MITGAQGRLWVWPHELERAGVLGINQRNLSFIQESNPRGMYPRVDDKTITKEICHTHGIPVPDTYAIIRRYGDVRRFLQAAGRPQRVCDQAGQRRRRPRHRRHRPPARQRF